MDWNNMFFILQESFKRKTELHSSLLQVYVSSCIEFVKTFKEYRETCVVCEFLFSLNQWKHLYTFTPRSIFLNFTHKGRILADPVEPFKGTPHLSVNVYIL